MPVKEYSEDAYVVMAASSGTIKKTRLTAFSRPRAGGIIAVNLLNQDYLIDVVMTHGDTDLLMVSDAGKAIRFSEKNVTATGRTSRGVRGIRLDEGQKVISLLVIRPDMKATDVLVATENGYGKRTGIEDYRVQSRGGKGVITIQTGERNGMVVGAMPVTSEDEIMLITDSGTLVRTPVEGVSKTGRNTQGVRLIRLSDEEKLVEVERIEKLDDPD